MKTLICFVLSLFIVFSLSSMITTASAKTTCTYKKVCKKTYKYHRTCKRTYYYAPGYCKSYKSCSGGCETVCYAPKRYSCFTDFYYHRGRNTARVEICD